MGLMFNVRELGRIRLNISHRQIVDLEQQKKKKNVWEAVFTYTRDTCEMTSVSMSVLYILYLLECIIIDANWWDVMGFSVPSSTEFPRLPCCDIVLSFTASRGTGELVEGDEFPTAAPGGVAPPEPQPGVKISQ